MVAPPAAPVITRGQQRRQHCPLSVREVPPADHDQNNELLIEDTPPSCGRSARRWPGTPPGPARGTPRPAAARLGGHRPGHGRRPADHDGGNPERLGGEASFAALCGVSPVERSSGRQRHHRLNRGGDRRANAALYRIVQSRLRFDARTRNYYERRIAEGKTRRENIRCLKRYAAREVFHLVGTDSQAAS
ncbi:transposase [Streptomyces platensis]|uniref:transposase n=1 Tax=Streptomyces platensis TaxID=58346 RepID=UPI0039B75B51